MAQFKLLVGFVAMAIVLGFSGPAHAASMECSDVARQLGTCSSTDGSRVILTGSQTSPGAAAVGGAASQLDALFARLAWAISCGARTGSGPRACDPGEPSAATPAITIADIAAFRPTPPRQQMEPDGWTVAGLDTNFYAITDPHVVSGTLLGFPADVRFTPIAFHWTYGDGTAATRSTKGGTWASLGIPEFDPTPTSHVYEQLGDYTITLDVTFAAEYRVAASPWFPVIGTLTLPANDLHLRVGTAKTVLVEHDCAQNAAGPGC